MQLPIRPSPGKPCFSHGPKTVLARIRHALLANVLAVVGGLEIRVGATVISAHRTVPIATPRLEPAACPGLPGHVALLAEWVPMGETRIAFNCCSDRRRAAPTSFESLPRLLAGIDHALLADVLPVVGGLVIRVVTMLISAHRTVPSATPRLEPATCPGLPGNVALLAEWMPTVGT